MSYSVPAAVVSSYAGVVQLRRSCRSASLHVTGALHFITLW